MRALRRKWDDDSIGVFETAGVAFDIGSEPSTSEAAVVSAGVECGVCLDDEVDQMIGLGCGHAEPKR